MRKLYVNGSRTITVLPTCPDCLALSFTRIEPGLVIRALKLYAKTRKLSPSDLEMHQKQAECLGLPQPNFKYDGKQDFCPDEEKPAVTEEEKQATNNESAW
uniref:Uncharacterized protein n=1 Tax=Anguilla anguilla TaxID=7936 RepID=A0A0E9Y0N2_ANGAN